MGTRSTAAARRSRPRTASPTRACRSRSGSRSGRRITSATSGTCTIASIRAAPCTPDGRQASPPTRKSRSVSSTARRASGRSSLVLHRAVFVALIALGAGSLLFDLTLGFRLPSDANWAEAAGALRARAQAGDAVPAGASGADAVDCVARRCVQVPVGGRLAARGTAGTRLDLRAGVIGGRAYDAGGPPIEVQVFGDGVPLGPLEVTRTVRAGSG